MNDPIERARLLGMDVTVEDGVIEVESFHLQGTYQDTDEGLAALQEDLNRVVTILQQVK